MCVTLRYGDDQCIRAKYKSAKEEDHKACVKAAKELISYAYDTKKYANPKDYTHGKFYSVKIEDSTEEITKKAVWQRKKPHYGGEITDLLFYLDSEFDIALHLLPEYAPNFLWSSWYRR